MDRGKLAAGALGGLAVIGGACLAMRGASTGRGLGAPRRASRIRVIDPRKLLAWAPKAETAIVDVAEGRTSRSTDRPVSVSRLESGDFWIIDGHHRAVEALQRGDRKIQVEIDEHVPRIERTGGAYASVLSDRVRLASWVKKI